MTDHDIHDEESARAFVKARCSNAAFDKVERFVAALIAENAVQNLIAAGTIPHIWQRHCADSAQLLDFVSGKSRCLARSR